MPYRLFRRISVERRCCYFCKKRYFRRDRVEVWEADPRSPSGLSKMIVNVCLDCRGIVGLMESLWARRRKSA